MAHCEKAPMTSISSDGRTPTIIEANTPEGARDRIAEWIDQLASARRSAALRTDRKMKAKRLNDVAEDLEYIARRIRASKITTSNHCDDCKTQVQCYENGCIKQIRSTNANG